MQKKQLKSLKRRIDKTWRMFGDKREKKEHSEGENYQKDLQQESYMNRQIRGMIKSTEQG